METHDYSPRLERNEKNSLSDAEGLRDRVYDMLEAEAATKGVVVQLLKSPVFTSPPWILAEAWVRNENDQTVSARTSATITFRAREFHQVPVEIDVVIEGVRKKTKITSIIEFGQPAAADLINILIDPALPQKLRVLRCRNTEYDFWRPVNKPRRFGFSFMRAFSSVAKWVLIASGVMTAITFSKESEGNDPGSLSVVVFIISILLVYYLGKNRRRFVLSAGRPTQEPRSLIRLDSWQTFVQGLGGQASEVKRAIMEELIAFKPDGFVVAPEKIWYMGADGKEEREQIVVIVRRAILFLHVYRYGNDLYLGWDAHVNCGEWTETVVGEGYDKQTRTDCEIRSIAAGWRVPSEYDVTDANCLIERVHSSVTKVLKLKLAEYKIDQEIDFKIIREQREGVAGRKAPEDQKKQRGLLKRFS